MRNFFKTRVSSKVLLLSTAFFFIFLGFNGAQQFVTTFFEKSGFVKIGFNSLILIYLFFLLLNPLAAVFVAKRGGKAAMVIASLGYATFILSLLSKSAWLIYLFSALIGSAAALLWTGQNTYLVRVSNKKSYGENAGFFSVLLTLGSTIGVFTAGLLIEKMSFESAFVFLALFPLLGFVVLLRLKGVSPEATTGSNLLLLKKALTSKTALLFSTVFFAYMFIFGLVIGVIPVQISRVMGISYVAVLSSTFYIAPILFSYLLGKLSDIKGRKSMIILSFLTSVAGVAVLYYSESASFLIIGVVLLAFTFAVMNPTALAVVGDIANERNLEYLTALFWMARNLGVVTALILSGYLEIKSAYLASLFIILISAVVFAPLLKLEFSEVKTKIENEMS